ncbi:hypothetical protein WJX77_000514 [Trebouxia sp. C0004]
MKTEVSIPSAADAAPVHLLLIKWLQIKLLQLGLLSHLAIPVSAKPAPTCDKNRLSRLATADSAGSSVKTAEPQARDLWSNDAMAERAG